MAQTPGLYLRSLTPRSPNDPRLTAVTFPEGDLSFVHAIPPTLVVLAWVAGALLMAETVTWFVPDRRIEKEMSSGRRPAGATRPLTRRVERRCDRVAAGGIVLDRSAGSDNMSL